MKVIVEDSDSDSNVVDSDSDSDMPDSTTSLLCRRNLRVPFCCFSKFTKPLRVHQVVTKFK